MKLSEVKFPAYVMFPTGAKINRGFGYPQVTIDELCYIDNSPGSPYYTIQKESAHFQKESFIFNSDTEVTVFDKRIKMVKDFIKKEQLSKLMYVYYFGYIGSDPEIFVQNKTGEIIPAFSFLPDKKKPILAVNNTNQGNNKLYWDGFQAEFDTKPNTCLSFHVDSVRNGLLGIYTEAQKHNKDSVLSIRSTVDVSTAALDSASDEEVAFGCDPSLNAYGMYGEIRNGRHTTIRSSGGHIHFGVDAKRAEHHVKIIKALDALIGVPCVSLFAQFDDPRRRTMYGLAGEYRLPLHGIEYRTLSNAWLSHPLIMNLVFDVARKAFMIGERDLINLFDFKEEEVIKTINTCDVIAARKFLKDNEAQFKYLLISAYGNIPEDINAIYNIFMNGMESVVKDPTDLVTNWNLDQPAGWTYHGGSKDWISTKRIIKSNKKVA